MNDGPFYKIVYDDGNIVTESFGIEEFDIKYTHGVLAVKIRHFNTRIFGDFMDIRNTRFATCSFANLSFVIESLPDPYDSKDDEFPKENRKCSNSILNDLIIDCRGNLLLRELNSEEKAIVERSKANSQLKQISQGKLKKIFFKIKSTP